ncbi:helix-turn-helix domain-containing protein [Chryseobacterium gallinarum]|uniref:Helix-turn-helix domain-containing protein n=1 Tax=Chryseobacterium gallinarum TaxID=1324352 RepID=A0ABX6KST1_CHRGL|nr:helix-turn-helix domain-containing protein [Chryseobacterium gallinarum]QIY91630.1 helix-turn-helix domain-containing protein [Chryseobacterium gallinarum]
MLRGKKSKKLFSVENLLKEYFFHYHILLLCILFIHIIMLFFDGNSNIANFLFGLSLLIVVVTIVIYKLEFSILKYFITYYLIVDIGLLNLLLFSFWKTTPELAIYLVLVPLGIYNLYKFKIVILWSVIILVLFIFIILLPDAYYPNLTKYNNLYISNIRIIVTFFVIALFLIYYNVKISEFKYRSELKTYKTELESYYEKSNNSTKEEDEDIRPIENIQLYSNIYKQIQDYFENDAPWKNSDFGIQDLAYQCRTNTTYISKAIKYNSNKNFNNFVNTYRINYIKEEIKNNHSKYTLMYIYTSAGFKHQSTFNKAFKQIENMTPSEFINSLDL